MSEQIEPCPHCGQPQSGPAEGIGYWCENPECGLKRFKTVAGLMADLNSDDMDDIEAADNVQLCSEILALRARVSSLQEGLRPLKADIDILDRFGNDFWKSADDDEVAHLTIKLGDLRRIRALLSDPQREPETGEGGTDAGA